MSGSVDSIVGTAPSSDFGGSNVDLFGTASSFDFRGSDVDLFGTAPSFDFGGSNVDFWLNMLSDNSQEGGQAPLATPLATLVPYLGQSRARARGTEDPLPQEGWCSRLDEDWGHVLKNNKKVTRKMKGSRSSTMNSGSDISEALSFISTELSLSSSSSSTSRSYGEADEDAQKDQDAHNLQELSGANHLEYLPVCVGGDIPSSESIEGDTFNASGEVNKDNLQVPKLGMIFLTEEEVYEFYKDYAMEIGFKVRKAKVQKLSDGSISKRYFFCSKQGLKQPSKKLRKYKRKVTRTGCLAKIQCTVKNGKWVISQVCVQHNHHLECQKQVKRPYSKTSEVQLTIHSENETKTIASTSGRYWGSGLLKKSSSEEDRQQRKFKRMRRVSNRVSARRSRMRKQKYLNDLVAQMGLLRAENNRIVSSVNSTTLHFLNVEAENSILRAQMSELSQRLESLNEIITCLNLCNNTLEGDRKIICQPIA